MQALLNGKEVRNKIWAPGRFAVIIGDHLHDEGGFLDGVNISTEAMLGTWEVVEDAPAAEPEKTSDDSRKIAIAFMALEKLSKLGNGDRPGNSDGNIIAQQALNDMFD